MHFKSIERNPERERLKRTICASGGFELLQMVSKPNTGQCASEDAEPWMGVDIGRCAIEDVGLRREWIVRSYIGWGGNQIVFYKGIKTFRLKCFKNLERKSRREIPKRTIYVRWAWAWNATRVEKIHNSTQFNPQTPIAKVNQNLCDQSTT